jgi:hypothetical protein
MRAVYLANNDKVGRPGRKQAFGLKGVKLSSLPGGGGNSAREKLLWEKFCPKFRDSIFTRVLSLGTEFFPLFLRKVQFYLVIDQ